MSHWNYRVIQTSLHTDAYTEVCLDIHEVYYDDDGKPTSWSAEPSYVGAHTKEDLLQILEWMKLAIEKPFYIIKGDELREVGTETFTGDTHEN